MAIKRFEPDFYGKTMSENEFGLWVKHEEYEVLFETIDGLLKRLDKVRSDMMLDKETYVWIMLGDGE